MWDEIDEEEYIEFWQHIDPVVMMQRAGFDPDPWQVRVLRSKSDSIMILCGRQMGKSTVTAVKALHKAIYSPGSLVLISSRTKRQSVELFLKIDEVYTRIGRPSNAESTKSSLEFDNRSRILALPGDPDNIVGFSDPSLIIIDEAARVKEGVFEAVSPMRAVSGGTMMLLSTPKGRRGFFFTEWEGGDGWERIQARASECPRITVEFLDGERRRLGEARYLQNYETEFIADDDQVFSTESIDRAFVSDVPALQGF